jgi:hypothetical protein
MRSLTNGANRKSRWLFAGVAICCFLIPPALFAAATEPDQYEVDDHYYQARSLALNGVEQSHTFHDDADEDWLSFYATMDNLYFLGTENPGANCNTVFELYNAEGKIIDDEIGSFAETHFTGDGEAEQVTWQCPGDGIYYLRVMQEDPEIFGEGTEYAVYLWDGTGPQGEMPVRGKVTNSKTLKPVQGAKVKLIQIPSGMVQGPAVTDSKGIYQLSATDGEYQLQVRATGYKSKTKLITVQGEPVTTNFALTPSIVFKPDLAVTAVTGPVAAPPGGSITVKSTLVNQGEATSGKFNLYIYLSEVPRVDFGRSRLLKVISGITLGAGTSSVRKNMVTIPLDFQTGAYRIVVSADQTNSVAESNETNNCKASLNNVTVE